MAEQKNDGRFTKGNGFWKLRATSGREAIFTTPQEILKAAEEYFQSCEDNPLYKAELRSSSNIEGHEIVEVPVKRPFTMRGFCVFCDVNIDYFNDFKTRMKKADTSEASEFVRVIKHIEDAIYTQKFDGAASGFFKENLIARDLGLKDATDVSTNGKEITSTITLNHLSLDELRRLAEDTGDQPTDPTGSKS